MRLKTVKIISLTKLQPSIVLYNRRVGVLTKCSVDLFIALYSTDHPATQALLSLSFQNRSVMSSSSGNGPTGNGASSASAAAGAGGSAAFSRLSRPGSGRLLTAAKGDNASLSWSAGWSNAQSSKSSRR
jgi:hypothetical protein